MVRCLSCIKFRWHINAILTLVAGTGQFWDRSKTPTLKKKKSSDFPASDIKLQMQDSKHPGNVCIMAKISESYLKATRYLPVCFYGLEIIKRGHGTSDRERSLFQSNS